MKLFLVVKILLVLLFAGLNISQASEIKVGHRDIKGRVSVKFNSPLITKTESGERNFVVTGRSGPGNIIIIKGKKSILVPPNGKFEVEVSLPSTSSRVQLQAVSPKGSRSVYSFDLPAASPSPEIAKKIKVEVQKPEPPQPAQSEFSSLTNEANVKVSYALGQNSALLGNANLRFWPEDLWNMGSHSLSKERWGLGLSYGQSISGIEYSFIEAPLYYRLYPGKMNRETTFALGAAYTSYTHSSLTWTGISVGALVGTPMPKLIGSMFNWISFLSGPKYLELELIYGFMPLDSTITGGAYGITGRGKFFTNGSFFTDISIYLRSHSFTRKDSAARALSMVGAAVGLGYLF